MCNWKPTPGTEAMSQQQQQQQSSMGVEGRHKEDTALLEFLASLMDYPPTIPDELVEHYLAKSGFQGPDVRLIRLVAVATQKFVAEVAGDALHLAYSFRGQGVLDFEFLFGEMYTVISCQGQEDKRLILMMDDLSKSLREYGVNVKHQEYFADSLSTGLDPASREE